MSPSTSTAPLTLPLCGPDAAPEEIYALMTAIRAFEESLLGLFRLGKLMGTTHTCLGQESTAGGVVTALDRARDIVFSNHRGHGHFLAYSGEIERLYREVMGLRGGVCAGRGGSQHLHWKNFYSNGVQGGIVPNAIGAALAENLKGSGAVVTVFLGDGTLGEGVVYESFNLASLWRLPVFFVIDNNGWAQTTPISCHLAGSIPDRLTAFGIPAELVSGSEVIAVRDTARTTLAAIRQDSHPRGLVIESVRLGPHSKGDDTRGTEEIAALHARDPLARLRERIGADAADRIEAEAHGRVDAAREHVLATPEVTL